MAGCDHRSLFPSATPSSTTNNNTIDEETIERLCDRLQVVTCIEERRDAIHTPKFLSKKCKYEVDSRCMTLLGNILQDDRTDLDLILLTFETLTNLVTSNDDNDEEESNLSNDINIQYTGRSFIE